MDGVESLANVVCVVGRGSGLDELEEEKQALFKRYIKYVEEGRVVTIEEDNGDRFENEYRVVSRATKNQEKFVDELMTKMAKARM